MLYFRILNSPLADEAFTSQETGIRHEINQLLLAYFGGSYQVNARERKVRKLFSPIHCFRIGIKRYLCKL